MRVVTTTPVERLHRLRRHAVAGWQRAIADLAIRDRASRWLDAHPSAMPAVDALWQQALANVGPLATWLAADADVDTWPLAIPLHSVLACHPFPDLPQWTEAPK
jgi:hypothetical protein